MNTQPAEKEIETRRQDWNRTHESWLASRGETASAQPENVAQVTQSEVQSIFNKASNEAYIASWRTRASEAEAQLDALTAQHDELLAALRRIDRRIHGSDGSNLPACRIVESIDEIVGQAIANAEQQ